jgi:hypothetical protein
MSTGYHDRGFPGYEIISRAFRPAVPVDYPSASWDPGDPHTLWKSISPCPGLAAPPPFPAFEMLLGQQEFAGRLIHFVTGWPQRENQSFAMISLRPMIHRIPPHPGMRPSELDEFGHPYYVLSDGTWGPYQASRYPQEFDHRRPWQPFHLFPDRRGRCPMEFLNPTEFFDFRGVCDDLSGGFWKSSLLRTLLLYREDQERKFLAALRAIGDPMGDALKEHFGGALPFVDNLTEAAIATWRTWPDGRDAVGHTLRYVGELGAIVRWLAEVKRQRSGGDPTVISTDLMGAWVGNIERTEDWEFLHSSPLPLYGLFRLLPDHPLHAMTTAGTLDNDEFYRTDALLSHLGGIPTSYSPNYPYGFQQRPINASFPVTSGRTSFLPHDVRVTPPRDHQLFDTPIAWMQPFTSYLFLDPRIRRNSWLATTVTPHDKTISKRMRKIARCGRRPMLPPLVKERTDQRAPFHPIVSFLRSRRPGDFKQRHFVEGHERGFFWATPATNADKKRYRQWDTFKYEHDLGNNDALFSDYPWPLINNIEPTVNQDEDDEFDEMMPRLVPGTNKRVYVSGPPSERMLEKAQPYRCLAPVALERQWINEGVGSRMGGNPYSAVPSERDDGPRNRQLPVLSFDLDDDDDDDLLDYTVPSSKRTPSTIVPPPPPVFASRDQWSGQRSAYSRVTSYSMCIFATACGIISNSASVRARLAGPPSPSSPDGERRHRSDRSRSPRPRRARSESSRDLESSPLTAQADGETRFSSSRRRNTQPQGARSETGHCPEGWISIDQDDLLGTEASMEDVVDPILSDSTMEPTVSADAVMMVRSLYRLGHGVDIDLGCNGADSAVNSQAYHGSRGDAESAVPSAVFNHE